jgi:asparagine synthase (glutamine-hydrolysing)
MPRFSAFFSTNNQISNRFALTSHAHGNAAVFNFENLSAVGELTIYNRAEIKRDLAINEDFSDGKIFLRLFAKYGIKGFSCIEGLFTAAIFDGENLFIVRDAIGKKTLFYANTKDVFLASSSLKSLLSFPQVEKNLNIHAVASFLTFAYLPDSETLLENVFELKPAHVLKISPKGKTELINYYEPTEQIDEKISTEQHIKNLRQTLEKSILNKLPDSNEDVGVFLSGGIDSSLVAALVAKFRPEKVRTYSISFGKENPNETAYSDLVAAHCGTNHRVLSFNGKQIAKYLAETVALLDCPVGDPLTVPNFLLAKAASEDGLTHVFNGEGGDPCFGGPKNLPMLIFALQQEQQQNLATIYLHSYRKCFDDLPFLLSKDVQNELRNKEEFARELTQINANNSEFSSNSEDSRRFAGQTSSSEFGLHLERFVQPFLETPNMNFYLNRLLYVNIRTKLGHHILPKVERMTSFWNLIGHSPLADKTIVDNSFTIPPELKLHGTIEKWILKEAVRDLLPNTIIDRPKSGMRVPVQAWLNGALRDLSNDLLFGKKARERGLFQEKTIRTWLKGEGLVYARQGGKLWLLLTLELWLQAFLDD